MREVKAVATERYEKVVSGRSFALPDFGFRQTVGQVRSGAAPGLLESESGISLAARHGVAGLRGDGSESQI